MRTLLSMLLALYRTLLKKHGPQGWWPLLDEHGRTAYTGATPKTRAERFEISIGALLTQNTAWKNVELALRNLWQHDLLEPRKLLEHQELVRKLIKPAGYYNQKTKKLIIFSRFFLTLKGVPTRRALLTLWGVGPETADSILLYAYNQPFFVIDAYTRRVLQRYGFSAAKMSYDELQERFQRALPRDVRLYKEFHALLVAEAKELRRRREKMKRIR